jgi:hypothetical protein
MGIGGHKKQGFGRDGGSVSLDWLRWWFTKTMLKLGDGGRRYESE